jgi:riboflavin synthase
VFTGLIEEIGTLKQTSGGRVTRLVIGAKTVLEGTRIGDSIAVNGACLTVTTLGDGFFTTDVMAETLRQTNLGQLRPGSRVNLERATALGGRMGGHLVQGHIDDMGFIVHKAREGDALWVTIEAPPEVMRYIVPRGFIAVDGASLTAARVEEGSFSVSLIPHTQAYITLPDLPIRHPVNLEADILAKYVERLLLSREEGAASGSFDREYLQRHGFA